LVIGSVKTLSDSLTTSNYSAIANSLQHALSLLSLCLHRLAPGNTPNAVDPSPYVFHGFCPRWLASISQDSELLRNVYSSASHASVRGDRLRRPPTGLSHNFSRLSSFISKSRYSRRPVGKSVSVSSPIWSPRRESKSESELLYDWRYTADQFLLAPSPLRSRPEVFATEPLFFYYC
jgi:hypothetical protein